jgi:hypothetical protein
VTTPTRSPGGGTGAGLGAGVACGLTGFGAGFLETLVLFAAFGPIFLAFLRGAGFFVLSFLRFSLDAAFFAFFALAM